MFAACGVRGPRSATRNPDCGQRIPDSGLVMAKLPSAVVTAVRTAPVCREVADRYARNSRPGLVEQAPDHA